MRSFSVLVVRRTASIASSGDTAAKRKRGQVWAPVLWNGVLKTDVICLEIEPFEIGPQFVAAQQTRGGTLREDGFSSDVAWGSWTVSKRPRGFNWWFLVVVVNRVAVRPPGGFLKYHDQDLVWDALNDCKEWAMLAKDSSDLPLSATQALDCLVQLRELQIALRYDAFGGLALLAENDPGGSNAAERLQEEKYRRSQIASATLHAAGALVQEYLYASTANADPAYDPADLAAAVTSCLPEITSISDWKSTRARADRVAILARPTWRFIQRCVSSRVEVVKIDHLPLNDKQYIKKTFAAELSRLTDLRCLAVRDGPEWNSLPELKQEFWNATPLSSSSEVLGRDLSLAASFPNCPKVLTALLAFFDVHGPNLRQLRIIFCDEVSQVLDKLPHLEHLILATDVQTLKSGMFNVQQDHIHLQRIFVALEELRIEECQWPTNERELKKEKNIWVPLSDKLLAQSVRLTDGNGAHWVPRLTAAAPQKARRKGSGK
ncbi:hypothetical protein BDV98DRAFT_655858 [Pterulicium gracile]|uniref:Uncharacterized protein n=1 Tax=Pterulicium gracile TaxID=1884261 RepID=A0A5C3QP18_9AGAR|nr:hypothetical protein BDV98DRAFT_655858 [Pterula gracilis]